MHRNTRRRPYRPYGYYFITTNVKEGLFLLETKLFGHLLEYVIQRSAHINACKIIAYKINPDHLHMIVQIGNSNTISKFIASMKRNFSRETNKILGTKSYNFRLCSGWDSGSIHILTPKFRWQLSYHSHLITSQRDYDNHIAYIKRQHIKHKLRNNIFCYINKSHVFRYR